ncbi:unnamed protein product [Rotaria magnacalcarata]|uniref:Uncharacterized protein n=1 Tax=Rotaria magnacalcarata TaxID=392030 RepID=A0A820H9C4_9BILA|nr:unnamed protein product [Rotaria magnacalcarata]CAF4292089.1 unnamed protein product [Rotaria magnacalcarata]
MLIVPPTICLVTNAQFNIDQYNKLNNAKVFLNDTIKENLYHESIRFDEAVKEAITKINDLSGTYGPIPNFTLGNDKTATNKDFRTLRARWRNYEFDTLPLGKFIQLDGLSRTPFAIKKLLLSQVKAILSFFPNIGDFFIKEQFINDIPLPVRRTMLNFPGNQRFGLEHNHYIPPNDFHFAQEPFAHNFNFPHPRFSKPIDNSTYGFNPYPKHLPIRPPGFNNNFNPPHGSYRSPNIQHIPNYNRPGPSRSFPPPQRHSSPKIEIKVPIQNSQNIPPISNINNVNINKPIPRYYVPQSPLLPNIPIQNDNNINNSVRINPAVPKVKKPIIKRKLSPIRLNESNSSLEKSIVKSDSFLSDPSPVLKKAKYSQLSLKLKNETPIEKANRQKSYELSIQKAIENVQKFRKDQFEMFTNQLNESKNNDTNNLRKFRIPKKFATVVLPKLPNFTVKLIGDSTASRLHSQIVTIPQNFNISLMTCQNKDLESITTFLMADIDTIKDTLNDNSKIIYVVLAGQHDLTRATGKNSCELNPSFNLNTYVHNIFTTELYVKDLKKIKIIWTIPLITDFKRYCSSFRNKIVSYNLNNTYDKNNFEKSMKIREINHGIDKFLIDATCHFINIQSIDDRMIAFDKDMSQIFDQIRNGISFPNDDVTSD